MTGHKRYLDKLGSVNSVYPPTDYLTNGPWIYMVPQFKPKSVLMLGYAGGTVAGLIRLLYGDLPITAVDIKPCEDKYGVNLIQADAKKYVKNCPFFDVCIIDLFPDDGITVCDFVLADEFVEDVSKICNYIILNTLRVTDMHAYRKLYRYGKNKPNRLSNIIYYFGTKPIVPDPILRWNT